MVIYRPIARGIVAFCCTILTACSPLTPATVPPQLTHTPGAYIEIADGYFNAGNFRFDYPKFWQLVKLNGAADDGAHVVLRAPTGGELSLRVVESIDSVEGSFIPLAKGNFLWATVDLSNDAAVVSAPEFERIIHSISS